MGSIAGSTLEDAIGALPGTLAMNWSPLQDHHQYRPPALRRDWQERSQRQNSNELAAQAIARTTLRRSLTRRFGRHLALTFAMPRQQPSEGLDHQLQRLDVYIVDVLAHLEGLLRHSHTIQRALLKLRAEAPPPNPASVAVVLPDLRRLSDDMQRQWGLLGEIIEDLATDIGALAAAKNVQDATR